MDVTASTALRSAPVPATPTGASAPASQGSNHQASVTGAPAPGDALKFEIADADVLARFAIHEGTSRVVVTLYNRDTGEVIREMPSRQVLDILAALAGRGLTIDVTT